MSWDDDDRYFSDPSRRPRNGLVIFVSLLVAMATSAALFFVVGRKGHASEGLVPALVGVDLTGARAIAGARGLTIVVTGQTTDPLVRAGAIATQFPLAGAKLSAGAKIGVTISKGASPSRASPRPAPARRPSPQPAAGSASGSRRVTAGDKADTSGSRNKRPLVTVPSLSRTKLGGARWRLRKAGLRVGRVRYKTDEDHIDGWVLGQSPRAGKRVPEGSSVDITVNRSD